MTLDVQKIRKDFPILERRVYGKPLVYFDNAATSQKPRQVIDALVHYYEHYNANIHRGLHTLAEEATSAYEASRAKAGRFINAEHPEQEIVFTRNTTESINLVANAWGRKFLKPGDEIVFSTMEHHSNLVPWQLIAMATGARLRFIEIDAGGKLIPEDIEAKIGARTKIVAISQMSNVLGTINPIREIAEVAHRAGAVMLVDGAQSVPHMPVDVRELGCDFLAFSSHKMLGPTGVGVLYGRRDLLNAMDPPPPAEVERSADVLGSDRFHPFALELLVDEPALLVVARHAQQRRLAAQPRHAHRHVGRRAAEAAHPALDVPHLPPGRLGQEVHQRLTHAQDVEVPFRIHGGTV